MQKNETKIDAMKRKSVALQYTSKHAIIYLLFKTCLGYQIHVKSIINST